MNKTVKVNDTSSAPSETDIKRFDEALRKLPAGYHKPVEVIRPLGWTGDKARAVIYVLKQRGLLEPQKGVKGPFPPIRATDNATAKPRVASNEEPYDRARVLFTMLDETLTKWSEVNPERVATLSDAWGRNLQRRFRLG